MRILMKRRGYGWDGEEEEKTSRMKMDILQGAGGQNKYKRGYQGGEEFKQYSSRSMCSSSTQGCCRWRMGSASGAFLHSVCESLVYLSQLIIGS